VMVCAQCIFEVRYAHLSLQARLLRAFRVLAVILKADLPPTADLAGRRFPALALRPILSSDAPTDHYLLPS
jgi:hypothetical protein